MRPTAHRLLCSLGLVAVTVSCSQVYYATMEKFGYDKRDILVGRVEDAQESQTEAKQEIQDTFTAFKALSGFDGGDLEALYDDLKGKLEDSKAAAGEVHDRVQGVQKVADAMFDEWSEEIEEFANADIKRKSKGLMSDTRDRYSRLLSVMQSAEARLDPVVTAFNDQVLFLKHNLNAQAVSSLQTEVVEIEDTVASLIEEMQRSIDEADAFIASMSG